MTLSVKRPSKSEQTRKRILEEVTDTSEKTRRLNVDVPDSLFRRIKIRALEEDISYSEITRQLWLEYLSK